MPPPMGRTRRTRLDLPAGVRLIDGRYYYRATTRRERDERRAKGLPETIPLGADPEQMRRTWSKLHKSRWDLDRADAAAGTLAELLDRFEADSLPAIDARGKARFAPRTRREYARQLVRLRERWGARRYAKTEAEAARGDCLGTRDLQAWLDGHPALISANRELALLSTVFGDARRWGLTVFNPCTGVRRHEEIPRDREVAQWELEAILAVAGEREALMVLWERATGWREGDVRTLSRTQATPEGVRLRQAKRGRKQLWEWTPALRAIWEASRELPGAKDSLVVFPKGLGKTKGAPLSVEGFQSLWARLLERTRAAIAQADYVNVVDAAPWLEAAKLPPLDDLHFHDLRAAAIDRAEQRGEDAQRFAGHTDPRTTRRHYLRSVQRVKPNE